MVTIKEAELLTGITRQNIRYYEKMGLIHPSREKENQYRKYNKDDIRRLKLIYMFRKLDMPLEEIQQILDGRKDLQEALEQQKEQLRQKQQKLAAALSFCGEIQETELTDLNVDLYLQKMEAEEKQGNKFADILDDYKKVVESESIRTFSFSPDDFCTTPRQMTEQLFRYAQRNHLDLVITKEGLCPEFTIDGKDVRDLSLTDLRHAIGVVPQRAVLFKGTLRDNMRWGKEDATDEEIWHALDVAQARDFIEAKGEGLDLMIDQGGHNLSGGQRQRLTIARALVRDPQILIMDDSASALDFATDARLRKAIRENTKDMTVFIVSQRATTIRNADTILVLDDGKLAGMGNHKQLLKECDVYREICLSQLSKEEVERDEQ